MLICLLCQHYDIILLNDSEINISLHKTHKMWKVLVIMETLMFSHFFINNEKQSLICFMVIKLKAVMIKNMIIQELETVGRDIG